MTRTADHRAPGLTSISVVVPVYAGEDYLRRLVAEVDRLRQGWRAADAPIALLELILVDDSARDGSPALIDALGREHDWVTPLHLSRNYGQHGATVAGIMNSSGDWVATLDEDLQHPPGRITDLLRGAVRHGADIAYAQPVSAVHAAKLRDWTSVGFKWLLQRATGNANLRIVNSFRLLRGNIARGGAGVAMHDTYLDVNLTWFSQRVIAVPMELRDERFIRTGKSGYRLSTLVAHAWRMLFSSNLKVLQLSTALGASTVLLSVAIALGILGVKVFAPAAIAVQGWASLVVIISFFGGLVTAMSGITVQYLSSLVLRAHGKPAYFLVDRSTDAVLVRYFEEAESAGSTGDEPARHQPHLGTNDERAEYRDQNHGNPPPSQLAR